MNRNLDALFAEKILGCRVYWNEGLGEVKAGPDCDCEMSIHDGEDEDPDGGLLRSYTSSLDATWEGAVELPLTISEFRTFTHDTSDGSRPYHWVIGAGYGCADHPAEALVLACLRAVGVSEEEIAEAQLSTER